MNWCVMVYGKTANAVKHVRFVFAYDYTPHREKL